MIEPGEDREYILKCKIDRVNQSYIEESDNKRHETKSILLIPDMESSETARMLTAYLPDVSSVCLDCSNVDIRIGQTECHDCGSKKIKTEWTEVPSWLAYPVNSPCRLAVLRKNNYCEQHHFYVMSTGVEQDLENMVGKNIELTILKSSEDKLCDTAKTINRSVK